MYLQIHIYGIIFSKLPGYYQLRNIIYTYRAPNYGLYTMFDLPADICPKEKQKKRIYYNTQEAYDNNT